MVKCTEFVENRSLAFRSNIKKTKYDIVYYRQSALKLSLFLTYSQILAVVNSKNVTQLHILFFWEASSWH